MRRVFSQDGAHFSPHAPATSAFPLLHFDQVRWVHLKQRGQLALAPCGFRSALNQFAKCCRWCHFESSCVRLRSGAILSPVSIWQFSHRSRHGSHNSGLHTPCHQTARRKLGGSSRSPAGGVHLYRPIRRRNGADVHGSCSPPMAANLRLPRFAAQARRRGRDRQAKRGRARDGC